MTLRRTAAVLLASSIPFAAGCPYEAQALFKDERDFDRRVSLERLRRIESLSLEADENADTVAPGAEAERSRINALRAAYEAEELHELSIEEARAAVLENNLDLRVALIAPTIAEQNVNEEEGRFEALLFANAQVLNADAAVASELDAGESQNITVTPGLRIPLRTGGRFEVRAPFNRNITDNQFTFLNPNYSQDLEFSISHPLLRGAGRRATMFQLRVADIDRQVSETQTKLEVVRQIAAADRAYWRLYAARQELMVRLQQYDLAYEQLERAQRRFRAGAVAEIEVVRAESGVADRVEAIITADNNVQLRQRELKRLLNIPGLDVDTEVDILTVSDPDPVPYLLDGPELAEAAMAQRMELLEIELNLARDAAAVAFQKNAALPLLSLDYTYRVDGLGSEFDEALRVASENRFETWTLGVNAEIPLGNAQRRAAVQRAVLTRLQRLATSEARRQSIRQEVLDAVDTINAGWQRIRAAQEAVRLNTRTLDAETRQFEVGRSNSIDVLDADTNLAQARLAEIQAVVDYQIAQIDLAFSTGTLLGASKVEWGPLDPSAGDAASTARVIAPVSTTADPAPADDTDGPESDA